MYDIYTPAKHDKCKIFTLIRSLKVNKGQHYPIKHTQIIF